MARRLRVDETLGEWIQRRAGDLDILNDWAAHEALRALWNLWVARGLDEGFDRYRGLVIEGPRVQECARLFAKHVGNVADVEFADALREQWNRSVADLIAAQEEEKAFQRRQRVQHNNVMPFRPTPFNDA